jgi:mannosyltransferase
MISEKKAQIASEPSDSKRDEITYRTKLYAVLVLGLALRIFRLDAQSFYYDESTQVILSTGRLMNVVKGLANGAENCPPLTHILYNFWLRFGSSDYWVRLLAALIGVVAIYAVYLLAREVLSRRDSIVAAFLMAINPFHIWYSQEARPYSLVILLNTLSMLFFLRSLSTGKTICRVLYVAFTALALYAHPYAAFTIAAQVFYLVIVRRLTPTALKWRLVDTCLPVILYLPWVWQMVKIMSRNAGFSKPVSIFTTAYTFFAFSLGFSAGPSLADLHRHTSIGAFIPYLPILAPLGVVFALLFVRGLFAAKSRQPSQTALLVSWILITVAGAFLIAKFTSITYNVRYVSSALPAFILILASGFGRVEKRAWRVLALLAVILGSAYSLNNHYFDSRYWKEDLRGSADYLEKVADNRDLILVADTRTFSRYYSGSARVSQELALHPTGKDAQAAVRDIRLGQYRRVWVVVAREWTGNTSVRLEDQFGWRHGSATLHRFPQIQVYEYRLR